MNKNKKLLALAIKGIFYIYLPVVLLLYIVYEIVFKRDIVFYWGRSVSRDRE